MKRKFAFWLKEYYLRAKHCSWFLNQTAYNETTDRLLNECLDNPVVKNISDYIVVFVHPSGVLYTFWVTNWVYAYGHLATRPALQRPRDYKEYGVYYTTRHRLKKFVDSHIEPFHDKSGLIDFLDYKIPSATALCSANKNEIKKW